MKLYLDTNIILGWFKKMMQKERKGEEFKIPRVIKFLTSKEEFDLILSNLTKVEIIRYLISEWGCDPKFAEKTWDDFMQSFDITYIRGEIDIDDLLNIVQNVPTKKRTLVNLLHLQIAKRYNLWFLTGEESLIDKYRKYYKRIITYKELRQKFS
mgnify:CR=1 FL=1